MSFIKSGKVVIVLSGRYAGKKAVIVKANADDDKAKKAGSRVIIAGVATAPRKIKKSMTKKAIAQRSTIKPFIKVINVNHLMPTRFSLDAEFGAVNREAFADKASRRIAKTEVKKTFEGRFKEGKNIWFFRKLAF